MSRPAIAREHSILGGGPVGETLAGRHDLDAPLHVARRTLELKSVYGRRPTVDDLRFPVKNGLARAVAVTGWGEDAR